MWIVIVCFFFIIAWLLQDVTTALSLRLILGYGKTLCHSIWSFPSLPQVCIHDWPKLCFHSRVTVKSLDPNLRRARDRLGQLLLVPCELSWILNSVARRIVQPNSSETPSWAIQTSKWRWLCVDASGWIGVEKSHRMAHSIAMFEPEYCRQTLPEMASHSHSLSTMITLNDLFAVVEEEQRKILELLGGGHAGGLV